MVESCCVEGCSLASNDVQYFRFPTCRSLKQKWLQAVKVVGKVTLKSVICSRHFRPGDYEEVRGKTRLKRRVVPADNNSEKPTKCLPKTADMTNSSDNNIKVKPPDKVKGQIRNVDDAKQKKDDTVENDNIRSENKCGNSTGNKNSETVNDYLIKSRVESNPVKIDENSIKFNNDKTEIDSNFTDTYDLDEGSQNLSKNNVEIKTIVKNGIKSEKEKINNETKTDTIDKQDSNTGNEKENKPQNSINSDRNIENVTMANGEVDKELNTVDIKHEEPRDNSKENSQEICKESDLRSFVPLPDTLPTKETDLEDIIANYQIKQTIKLPQDEGMDELQTDKLDIPIDVDSTMLDVEYVSTEVNEPTFIEVSTDNGKTSGGVEAVNNQDCMMLLESVEVELDPSSLMFDADYSDVDPETGLMHPRVLNCDSDSDSSEELHEDPNPISLLTSSDDDEVIIEEPEIDTIEVSDEDEDDVPLVKLAKPSKKSKKNKKSKTNIMQSYQYNCLSCCYKTSNKKDYKKHSEAHASLLRVCDMCNYTTASQSQFSRHQQKHKTERKYKCHVCSYRAKHHMSLIYHLKTHSVDEVSTLKVDYQCDTCGYGSDAKSKFLSHLQLCSTKVKRFKCNQCTYNTDRSNDLKRHRKRKHDDDDEDYIPTIRV